MGNKKAPVTAEKFECPIEAADRMIQISNEKENYLVGMWETGNDWAKYIAINGAFFEAAD